ncbi:MAG: hypothetical protein ACE360_11990 [Hyphomicrobiales bacterium]
MADFDAILRKALASRPGAPGEERRKIYERARQALVRQLTGFEPPLPPEDISRQRLALESAIRKVEADVAANGGILPGAPAAAPSAPAPTQAAPAPTPPARPAPVSRATPVAPPPTTPATAPAPATPPARPAPVSPVTPPVARPPAARPPVAAPATADGPRFDPPPTFDDPQPITVDEPAATDLPDFEPERSQPEAKPAKKRSGMAGVLVGVIGLLVVAGGGLAAWQLGLLDPYLAQQEPGEDVAVIADEPLEEAPEVRTVGSDPTRSSERLLPDNQGTVEDVPTETPSTTPEVASTEPAGSGLPVAQTAILYEEGLTPDADGFTAPGRAVWRLEEGDNPAILGTIEVPARGILMNMRISRNLDDALPATHLIEFDFELSEAFPATSIAELVGVVVKPQEQSGGDPLRGAIVDLGEGVFWQALAAGEADQAVNVPLLRDGRWFDLPILYDDNRRAIITFEKGNDGVAVFQQALNAWSN